MKIKITVELDIPEFDDQSNEEMTQNIFDAYTNYITCKHLEDALKWCSRARIGTENEDPVAKAIYSHHDTWADICGQARVSYEFDTSREQNGN
jgi:hypothetical protein